MNQSNDDQRDLDLEGLGSRLRRNATRHDGDLGELLHRASKRRRRTQIGLAIACVVLFLTVGGAGIAVAGRDDLGPAGQSTESWTTETTSPSWTVNPSLGPTAPIVWAVEVEYDPALWNFERFKPYLIPNNVDGRYGMAGGRNNKYQLYWEGSGAEAKARSVQAELQGQPGIISVEAAQARNTQRSPTTGHPAGVGSVPPATAGG